MSSAPKGAWTRTKEFLLEKLVRPILRSEDSPHALALGISLGLFVGLTPTVGMQLVVVLPLAALLRASKIAAGTVVWISNVFTAVPLYYLYYRCGLFLMGQPGTDYSTVKEAATANEAGAWGATVALFEMLGWPLWVGSLAIATLCAAPAYPIFRWVFTRRQQRQSERAGIVGASGRPSLDEVS